jgi:hypothetical protein
MGTDAVADRVRMGTDSNNGGGRHIQATPDVAGNETVSTGQILLEKRHGDLKSSMDRSVFILLWNV